MFKTNGTLFHTLDFGTEKLPKQFTYPFYYSPHPLCITAAQELKCYLSTQTDFDHNFGLDTGKTGLKIGKMFGVMIVEDDKGTLGYLAGFSGKLAESNTLDGFVPPIFDTLKKEGFYKKGEAYLNVLNAKIERLEKQTDLESAKAALERLEAQSEATIRVYKAKAKAKKLERRAKRQAGYQQLVKEAYDAMCAELDQESIQSHLGLKHLKRQLQAEFELKLEKLKAMSSPLVKLKKERRQRSAELQGQLHQAYRFLNAKGETKDLLDIFETQPPAAAGECAAPKLFQYAYQNHLKPIAMAEFWWGAAPRSEVRRHGQFYPSCRSKCEPILGHMMQGLDVEPSPMLRPQSFFGKLDIIFEDNYLLVLNKPEEFLSVPGKTLKDSILSRLKAYLPDAKGPLLVHRLDMSTSGILIVAKNEKTHKNLQKQFMHRTVKKRYVALLEGVVIPKVGLIDLPLRVDLNNRPRQLVCYEHGKPAKTTFEVVEISDNRTRIHFYPITGRTHQLRVHAAHHLGLNAPIVGDDLYGTPEKRLHLHAEAIRFEHPVRKEEVLFEIECPF